MGNTSSIQRKRSANPLQGNGIPKRVTAFSRRKTTSSCDSTITETVTSVVEEAKPTEVVLRKPSRVPESCPADLIVVRDFIRFKDEHNIDQMKAMTSDECDFHFEDTHYQMRARDFYEAMDEIYKSFPDLHFLWSTMQIKGVNGPDHLHPGTVVVISKYYGVGHHTGAPYGFGPYPPIEPVGKRVRDADIEFTFIVNGGMISHAVIYAFGKPVGPPGFYTAIGGLIF